MEKMELRIVGEKMKNVQTLKKHLIGNQRNNWADVLYKVGAIEIWVC